MKKAVSITFALFLMQSFIIGQSITSEERKKVINHLKSSKSELLATIKGLSENQLNFKPAKEEWSIAECVEHIAISEANIFGMFEMTIKEEPNPSRRSEVKMSDEQVLGLIASRANKVKTRQEFEPTNSFGSYAESIEAFTDKRKSNIKYMKSSEEDMRNRYFVFPFGTIDSYQIVLFMSGHTSRHTDQIKEVMRNSSFPSK